MQVLTRCFQTVAFDLLSSLFFTRIKRFVCLVSFLFIFANGNAQYEAYYDSVKNALPASAEDTNKVWSYADLAYHYQWSNPDSSLYYSMPGLALAKKLNFAEGEYQFMLPLSETLSMMGNYSQALAFRFRAMEMAVRLKDSVRIANCYALTGNIYLYATEYKKALEYFYKAKATNKVSLGGPKILNGFFGQAYFHLGNLDSALLYVQRAYDEEIKGDSYPWPTPYQLLASIYEKKGDYVKALDLYRQAIPSITVNIDRLRNDNGMALVFSKTGQTDSAIYYSKKVIAASNSLKTLEPLVDANALLAKIYKSTNNTDSAFKYQEMLVAAKDSLFSQEKVKQLQNVAFDEQFRQQEMSIQKDRFQNRIKLYALLGALGIFVSIGLALWKNNRSKQKANVLLDHKNKEIETALTELKETQAQLIQSEKMASLGQLTAGIAHEIQNPLNFVNNFSEINEELIGELKSELAVGNLQIATELAGNIENNLEKINHHGKRADAIVKGMLEHSRQGTGQKQLTDINTLADEYLKLAYIGLRAKQNDFNATIKTMFDEKIDKINIIPQDIGRVLLNLYNNAFYALNEKIKMKNEKYEPTLRVETKKENANIVITVSDNGNGIPQNILNKIFQPFFTTKPTGQGTGLGLSLAYDMVKAQGGELSVTSEEGVSTQAIIQLPIKSQG